MPFFSCVRCAARVARGDDPSTMRVFLTGFMASGKTTVGRELAALLGARFVDLDGVIEEDAGAAVEDIFAAKGEDGRV